jgi:hypothetical protein
LYTRGERSMSANAADAAPEDLYIDVTASSRFPTYSWSIDW